ncbi:MAG: hypothetical protein Q8L86_08915, partial [Vicinamibacterales bacterium]|nr:hypothetical protein [Vicinamibacterales bacterium]
MRHLVLSCVAALVLPSASACGEPETLPADTHVATVAPDTVAPDTVAPDTGVIDTVVPDTGLADTVAPDAVAPDTHDPGDVVTCAPIDDCAEVTCAAGPSVCTECHDGFEQDGDGGCVDIDDCDPSPCGLATCVDTGPHTYACHAHDVISNGTGGTAILTTPRGYFVATAGPLVFVDGSGSPVAGDVRLVVAPDGFAGHHLTDDGLAFDHAVLADIHFEDLLGAPVHVAASETVTLILPLPADAPYGDDDPLLVYRYDEDLGAWAVEAAGVVVPLAPLGEATPDGPGLGVSAALGRFSWYGAGETCAALPGCGAVACADGTCTTCLAGYQQTVGGTCEDIDDCLGHGCAPGACVDLVGGHTCDCPAGTWLDAVAATPRCATCAPSDDPGCAAVSCDAGASSTCTACASGYALADGACLDLDDCDPNPCGDGACTDAGPNAWTCACPDGTFLDAAAPGGPTCTACGASAVVGCVAVTCASAEASVCAACASGYAHADGACVDLDDCDPNPCGAGLCSNPPGNDGGPCDDGDVATHGDACDAGACVGAPIVCPDDTPCATYTPDGTATCVVTPTVCDDGDPCTEDQCDPASGCVHPQVVCAGDALDGCHLPPSCEPTSGECVSFPVSDSTPCDDGDACTLVDRCLGGVCTGSAPCDDLNPCTAGACVAGACVYTVLTGACDDGLDCTTGDTCVGGRCVGAPPPACDDDNPCTRDRCDGDGACHHDAVAGGCVPEGACTVGVCVDGACTASASITCDDGNPCTDDTCDPATGCVHTPNTAPCSDANTCTVGDLCAEGSCVPGPARDCVDGNPCTADLCHASTGCANPPLGGPCDDG